MHTSHESDIKDIARGAGVNYFGFIARLGSRTLFLFLAGLLFGKELFGRYTFAVALVETVAAFAVFGLKRSMFKFIGEAVLRKDEKAMYRAIANAFVLSFSISLVSCIIIASGADLLALMFRSGSVAETLRLIAVVLPFIVTSDVLLAVLRFKRDLRYEVFTRSIAEPLTLTLSLILAYSLGFREQGLILAYMTSLVLAATLSIKFFSRSFSLKACAKAGLRWSEMIRLFRFSGPTALYDVINFIFNKTDIFLIAYFFPDSVVGIYGMAWQISTIVKKIRQGFDPILSPVVSQSIAEKNMKKVKDQLSLVFRWILSIQTPILLAAIFFGSHILGLFGEGFAAGSLILVLLIIGDTINGTLGFSDLPILYMRPILNPIIASSMLLVNIGLILLFIPIIGPEGAALGVALAYFLSNFFRLIVDKAVFNLSILNWNLAKPLGAGLISTGGLVGLSLALPYSQAPEIIGGMLFLVTIYTGAYFLLGLEREDRIQLSRLFRYLHLRKISEKILRGDKC